MMLTNLSARLRYTLDRDSQEYATIYRQRTAGERVRRLQTLLVSVP